LHNKYFGAAIDADVDRAANPMSIRIFFVA